MVSRAYAFLLAVADFAVTALLVWALWPHSRNYYVLLRFLVCIFAGINLYVLKPHWIMFVVFGAIIVLFNPVAPFNFAKSTWTKIDLITAGLFVLVAVALPAIPSWTVTGILLIGISALSLVYGVHIVMSAARLMNGIKVQGKVIDMGKDEVDSETNGNGIVYTSTYQFRTQSGDLITGSSEHGDDVGDVVTVIYNPNDPHENRIEGDSDKTLSGAIPRSLLTLL